MFKYQKMRLIKYFEKILQADETFSFSCASFM